MDFTRATKTIYFVFFHKFKKTVIKHDLAISFPSKIALISFQWLYHSPPQVIWRKELRNSGSNSKRLLSIELFKMTLYHFLHPLRPSTPTDSILLPWAMFFKTRGIEVFCQDPFPYISMHSRAWMHALMTILCLSVLSAMIAVTKNR